jgi:AraC-like DNA-binding protein
MVVQDVGSFEVYCSSLMVKSGHGRHPGVSRRARRSPVTPVEYTPPAGYRLDLEIYPVATLRRKARAIGPRRVERTDFHVLIYVTAGRYRHIVDFETYECAAGSLLTLQPGQVHRFGNLVGWKGWLLIFRSDLVQDAGSRVAELELFGQVEGLPTHLKVAGTAQKAVTESVERMAADTQLPAGTNALNALLRSELQALLARLHLAKPGKSEDERIEPLVVKRFRRYRTTMEREYRRWHSVAQYARHLGCSQRSLSRATLDVADMSAKAMLTQRIVLEAKRLLAHSVLPVATIGDQLGFDEATNFVKFFRREAGLTPGAFRTRQASS